MVQQQSKKQGNKTLAGIFVALAIILLCAGIALIYMALGRTTAGMTPGNYPVIAMACIIASGMAGLAARNPWK